MINIVGSFQRKAIELMNNVNKIIKIISTLYLRNDNYRVRSAI